jgi:diguanylate cyclase (GGDEF)-like protein/PAS domain S-box-containing protein
MRSLSLKLKIPLLVVVTFWLCIWILAYTVSRALRADMQDVLSNQQYSLVGHLAGQINEQVENRLALLVGTAASISRQPQLLGDAEALEDFLADHQSMKILFSGGSLVIGRDGVGIADYPPIGRRGVDYSDREYFREPLSGSPVVSHLVIGKKLRTPIFAIGVPIRNSGGEAVAALAGITNLAVPNFLGRIIGEKVGRTGSYMIVSPTDRKIVMASDQSRIFQSVAAADDPMLQRYIAGMEGSGIGVNAQGIEQLSSAKRMAATGWILVAILPTDEAFAPIVNLQQRVYKLTALLSILFALVVGWIVRRQLAPLGRAARQIANMGDLPSPQDPLQVGEANEIGELLSNFNKLQARISASRAEADRERSKFAAIFNLTPDPMAISRLGDGQLLAVSRSFAEYFGYAPEQLVGRSISAHDLDLWAATEGPTVLQERLESNGSVIGMEAEVKRGDGHCATVLLSGKLIELDGERCCIFELHDITENKRQADRLEEIAHNDALTHLPNRLLLEDRMELAIAQSQRAGTLMAVCYLDLDAFKPVNDTFGHAAGDRLLIEIAERLKATVRGGDTVARLGGDEFVVLLTGLTGEEECMGVLDRMVLAVAQPFRVNSHQVRVSASIGVTIFPNDKSDPDALLRHADHAMYAAKQAGKDRYHLFDTRLEQSVEARHVMMKRIQTALAANELRLYYQPKIDCRRGVVVGLEALIRWQNPMLGLLSPAEFLPLIEADQLALAVGGWVVREALRQMALWNRQGSALHVSINAFIRHLLEPDFVRQIAAGLDDNPEVSPQQFGIEIVETTPLKDLDAIQHIVADCQAMGICFSLDDFGTAYSSLDYLRHLPAHELKIDQSFVRNMLDSAEDMAIVEAVIGLGRAFHRSVVAEGVETAAHVQQLLTMGCDVMQGYFFARPMPADEVVAWVRRFRPDPAWRAPGPSDIATRAASD